LSTTISVALCTYNGERFVAEQVESILEQTLLPTEIVVSDDASTDATIRIIEGVIKASSAPVPTVRILRNLNPLGVVRNFEQAVSACSGELISLCDQDDRWTPRRLELMAEVFATDPDVLLLNSNARLVDDDDDPLGYSLFDAISFGPREKAEIHSGRGFAALLARNTVTGATTLFRRSLLDRALPFPDSWVHDEWLAIIAAASGRIDFLDDVLIDYRQHSGNAIGAVRLGLPSRFRKLLEPRSDRNRRLNERAMALVERLRVIEVSSSFAQLAESKLRHEDVRSALPAGHFARVGPVLREAAHGGYRRFGRGAQDVLRDLVQPAR
jgi:glycosyltransferase involved in cell wall biosynthesis